MSDIRLTPSVRRGLSVHPLLRQTQAASGDAAATGETDSSSVPKRRPMLKASRGAFAFARSGTARPRSAAEGGAESIAAHVGLPCDNPVEDEGSKRCDDV
jgi:hypothetical protein